MAATDSDDGLPPLDPAAERVRRKLARLLMVSGGIMTIGLIAVFSAIVYKLGLLQPGEGEAVSGPASLVEASIAMPRGARLVSAALDGERALLTMEASDGSTSLLLVDLGSATVLGRYVLEPQ